MTTSTRAPLVTVGVPVFNGARFLPRALDALLAQHWPSLEIILSDNASTDGTSAIADQYAARDPRIRVLRWQANVGVSRNFSRVLEEASGEYFMWAACDDWWSPAFVPSLVGALEHSPSAVVAMSAVERVDEENQTLDVVRFSGASDPARLSARELSMRLAGGRPYHLFIYGLYRTAFVRRAFTGFAPVIAADRLFMCRVAMSGGFVSVDDVLHRRLVRQVPIARRYAGEAIGRHWRQVAPRWRLALAAGPYLWRSPVLPSRRRSLVPLIVARFLRASLGDLLVRSGIMKIRPAPESRHARS